MAGPAALEPPLCLALPDMRMRLDASLAGRAGCDLCPWRLEEVLVPCVTADMIKISLVPQKEV